MSSVVSGMSLTSFTMPSPSSSFSDLMNGLPSGSASDKEAGLDRGGVGGSTSCG